ncbi:MULTISPECIES: diguanylate cyclase [unclassified Actinopolyspora]|uniref:putative bifunctional diguanylate cyclase/phosphodiesterase n=1 Tax=unclassified Actinopolyspora TaxID=2639451 RepID=UPI0013F614FB|nr:MULTISPECIES: diguanylate cyclase [unclassified Actinopolyspora]NHD17024.1 diguanylate cyclase [Actinopolyspora sp. BKK2]NHE76176.1 diguanylate cyclase [Actinopolyspora sp. BKK1]
MSRASSGGGASSEGFVPDQRTASWGSEPWCAELAAQWARRLDRTSYVPMARESLEDRLRELVGELVDALRTSGEAERAGERVGEQLVRLNATGEDSLARSLDLLCRALLPASSDESTRQVFGLLASLASGYAAADRATVLDQQEHLRRALLRSKADSEHGLRASRDGFREIFRTTPVGVGICDRQGTFLEVNEALESILGYSGEELRSRTLAELLHPDEADFLANTCAELLRGTRDELRERRNLLRADGGEVWTRVSLASLPGGEELLGRFVVMVEDLRELSSLQERLQHQTLHDAVTGLPNRQHFRSRLETALAGLPATERLTLYQLRLDGFELINEGLGYEVGDEIVRTVANRLQGLVEDEDGLVARIGGTEFAVLIRQEQYTPEISEFAELINEELDEPIYIGESGLAPTASIGVIQRAVGDQEPTDMMWAAEVALRGAEQAGKRQWALFDPHRAPSERSDARLAAVMPGALELGEFEVRYRPWVSLAEGSLFAVEVRLSWQPSGCAELDHDECLRLAELSGITLPLRDWMLRTAWTQLGEWHAQGLRPQLIAGLSPNQSRDPDLVAVVRDLVDGGELDAGWLRLCVSMKALMSSGGEARDNVTTLAGTGVQTAAHEFSGAPSELRFLREFPTYAALLAPDVVRLVGECASERDTPEARALAGVIPLVRDCGVPVAASGVSTEHQARWWREAGCAIASGPYYGTPLDAAGTTELLRSGTAPYDLAG